MILTSLQKLSGNVGDLGRIIVAISFEWFPKCKKSPNLVTLTVTVVVQSYFLLIKVVSPKI